MFLERLRNWLDRRTNYRAWLAPWRDRQLPNGPSFRYVTGSCLFWVLMVNVVSGFLLMATYSPSTSSAWASVHYIENISGGSFIRGLHYYGGQALIILFAIHIIRVLLAAAFRAPHELVWVTGLFLFPLVVLWAITGNPLSWSQTGYGQIEVESNIMGSTPFIGPIVQKMLMGGDEPGNLTVTHLHFLHVGLFPLLVGFLLIVHMGQVYKHGLIVSSLPARDPSRSTPYWPHQSFRNFVAFSAVLGIISYFALNRGAPFDAPADSTLPHTPRPEWYFMFLFELRRYFTGNWEFVATIVIPTVSILFLLSMPLLDRILYRWLSFLLRSVLVLGGVAAWSWLSWTAYSRDRNDSEYQASLKHTAEFAERAKEIADKRGIPPEGAIWLLRNDPHTQGPMIFERACSSCHAYGERFKSDRTAPDLAGFGSEKWLKGLFDPEQIAGRHYFGNTPLKEGDMIGWVKDNVPGMDDAMRRQLDDAIIALVAEAQLPGPSTADEAIKKRIQAGQAAIKKDLGCADCHHYQDAGELGAAPDLTGYASREWLLGMISDPNHQRFYAYAGVEKQPMPAFAKEKKPEENILSPREIEMLIDWMRGEEKSLPTPQAK